MKVLFFASLREALGCESLELTGETVPKSVQELRTYLSGKGDVWSAALADERLLVAINHEMVSDDAAIAMQDEVAFFPPVTGG